MNRHAQCILQLSHVDRIGERCAGGYARNLTSHLCSCIAYGNGSCRRFPCTRSIAAVVFPLQVEANGPFIGGGNGAAAQSHAVIYGDVGVIAQDGDILVAGGQFRIGGTHDDRVVCTVHYPVIAQQLGFLCILQAVPGAQDGDIGSIIDDVAVTYNSRRTAAVLVLDSCTHGFRQCIRISNAALYFDSRCVEIIDGVGHLVAGAYHDCAIGILCPVRRAQDAVCHACRIMVFTGQTFHAVQGAYYGSAKVLDSVGLRTPLCIMV